MSAPVSQRYNGSELASETRIKQNNARYAEAFDGDSLTTNELAMILELTRNGAACSLHYLCKQGRVTHLGYIKNSRGGRVALWKWNDE